MLCVVEAGGRTLPVVTDGATELGQGMRAGGGQVHIGTGVGGKRMRESASSHKRGGFVIDPCRRRERKLGHIASQDAIDSKVTGAAAIEPGRLGHAQGDSLVGQPVLADLVVRVEPIDDRLLHQPSLDEIDGALRSDIVTGRLGQIDGCFQRGDRGFRFGLFAGEFRELGLCVLHRVLGGTQFPFGRIDRLQAFLKLLELGIDRGVIVPDCEIVVGPSHVAKCSQGLCRPQLGGRDTLLLGESCLKGSEVSLDAVQVRVPFSDLLLEFLARGREFVLLVQPDSSQASVLDPVKLLLPDSPLVVVVVVKHPQRRPQQHQAADGKDHVGLRQVAEKTVCGGHGMSGLKKESCC